MGNITGIDAHMPYLSAESRVLQTAC